MGVFGEVGELQQFIHCQFREHVVRLLYLDSRRLFLVVNKWGNVGIFSAPALSLIATFFVQAQGSEVKRGLKPKPLPRCQRTTIVSDALSAEELALVIFASSKGILHCYDTGALDAEALGLELLPRGRFLGLTRESSPCSPSNHGFVETHRIFLGSHFPAPTALSYVAKGQRSASASGSGLLLVGDESGRVTLFEVDGDAKAPFIGRRKLRGSVALIRAEDLVSTSYMAHRGPVKCFEFWNSRSLILSSSRKMLHIADASGVIDPNVIEDVSAFGLSEKLGLLVTGAWDGCLQIYREFALKAPAAVELAGHKSVVVGLDFLPLPFSEAQHLISYAEDLEIRVWDLEAFNCLQSTFLRFPSPSGSIFCKSPSFPSHPIFIWDKPEAPKAQAFILFLYCNSFGKLELLPNERYWPFDFEETADAEAFAFESYKPKASASSSKTNQSQHLISPDDALLIRQRTRDSVAYLTPLLSSEKWSEIGAAASQTFRNMTKNSSKFKSCPSLPPIYFDKVGLYPLQKILPPAEPKPYIS